MSQGLTEAGPPSDGSSSVDDALRSERFYDVLGNARRRCVLQYLNDYDGPVQIDDLVDEIGAWENQKPVEALTANERKRVATSLHQTHLPKLEAAGLVSVDATEGIVEAADDFAEIDVYLEVIEDRKVSYSEAYLGLAALGAVAIAGSAFGVSPLAAVSTTTWAAVTIGAFGVVSMVHMFHLRHMKVDSMSLIMDTQPEHSFGYTTDVRRSVQPSSRLGKLVAGIGASLPAGLAMAAVFHYVMFMLPLVGSVYGQPTVMGGLVAHLAHGVVFGLGFVVAIASPPIEAHASKPAEVVALGTLYGILLWIFVEGLLLPLAMPMAVSPMFGVLYLPTDGLVAHLVYGILLGVGYAVMGRWVGRFGSVA